LVKTRVRIRGLQQAGLTTARPDHHRTAATYDPLFARPRRSRLIDFAEGKRFVGLKLVRL
jgi:hypothetical protein